MASAEAAETNAAETEAASKKDKEVEASGNGAIASDAHGSHGTAAAAVPSASGVASGGCCFELLGFDVMCDASGWPWLLEVNRDPSLATDTQVDLHVKAKVLVDLLNVVLRSPHSVEQGGNGGSFASNTTASAEQVEKRSSGWRRLAIPAK